MKLKTLIISTLPIILLACLTTTMPAAPAETTATPAATTTATPTATTTPTKTAVLVDCAEISAESLHIRLAASYHAQMLGWLTEGTVARVLIDPAPVAGWTKIHAPGIDSAGHKTHITGYVKGAYLTVIHCPDEGE